jgi:predicted MFS family arabinose efflux permease
VNSSSGHRGDVRVDRSLGRAVSATYVAFIGSGFAFASWASRIPQVRDRLDVTPGALGLILLSIAVGSILAIPNAGLIVARLGEARTVAVMSGILTVGVAVIAIGYNIGTVPVAAGLFLMGFGNGAWDVAMNVQGAAVERMLGKSIMSRFHAGYSIGTVAGAAIGTAMVALRVPVTAHLLAVAVIVGLAVPTTALRGFLPHVNEDAPRESRRALLSAWRETRTLLIGLFVLCMAFTEGTGFDWVGVAVIDGYHTTDAFGTITLAVFLAAMTTGRWFGPALLDRHGRVPVLRSCALLAFAGLLVVVFGQVFAVAVVGTALWGLGTSLGFPTGISAAADDPRRAPARVSVAASIAYLAFLAGPPLIGFVGDHVGVLRALTVAAGLLAIAVLVCGATAPVSDPADPGSPAVPDPTPPASRRNH